MEIVEAPPVISLLVMVLMGVWGFIGGPTALLPAFLMYFMVSTNASGEPIAQDAVSVESSVSTPRPIPVP